MIKKLPFFSLFFLLICISCTHDVDITAPGMVSNLNYEADAEGNITINWKNPEDADFSGIKLRVIDCDNNIVMDKELGVEYESYSINEVLIENTIYTVLIYTHDKRGNYSEVSLLNIRTSVISAADTVLEDITPPAVPADLTYEVVTDGNVKFTWKNPSDNDFSGLFVKINPSLPLFSEKNLSNSETTLLLSGFEHEKVYSFTIAAYDESGNSSESAVIKYMLPLDVAEDSWFVANPVQAHAGGGMIDSDGRIYIYTNSIESIIEHYENGYRVFEVDLDYTIYKTPVLCHDWNMFASMANLSSSEVTLEIFKNSKLYDLYTPATLENLIDLMLLYTDFYVDIDSKGRDPAIWVPTLVSYCEQRNALDILDRFIIEFYSEDNWNEINSLFAFKNYFYADYMMNDLQALTDEQHQSVIEFCIKNKIPYYETNDAWITPEILEMYHSYNIKVITWGNKSHNTSQFQSLKAMGVDAIQSDWVTNEMWNGN